VLGELAVKRLRRKAYCWHEGPCDRLGAAWFGRVMRGLSSSSKSSSRRRVAMRLPARSAVRTVCVRTLRRRRSSIVDCPRSIRSRVARGFWSMSCGAQQRRKHAPKGRKRRFYGARRRRSEPDQDTRRAAKS